MDILIVDDEKIIRDSVSLLLEDAGHYTEGATDTATALKSLAEADFDLVLLDMNIGGENGLDLLQDLHKRYPNLPIVVFTGEATIKTAVEAMRLGALDFLEKPFSRQQLGIVLSRIEKHRKLADKVDSLQQQVATQSPEAVFETASDEVRAIYEVLFRAASTTATVLILGESGTGKTVAARAVHQASPRASKPFVTINSPGLSKELIESELFGHVKGAFTGAIKDHWGKVRSAEGGTLFLDEIGEIPLDLQAKLLRLLQDRQYERVGESTSRSADVRVIAATNRDLKKAVQEGSFREDLYYRLNVITVEMPPLRRRPNDLLTFAENYVKFFNRQFGRSLRGFSTDARKHLLAHNWPGNLRELRNAVERAVILGSGKEIMPTDLPLGESPRLTAESERFPGGVGESITLEALEAAHIQAMLEKLPNLADVARVLGIDQSTLYRKRRKLGI